MKALSILKRLCKIETDGAEVRAYALENVAEIAEEWQKPIDVLTRAFSYEGDDYTDMMRRTIDAQAKHRATRKHDRTEEESQALASRVAETADRTGPCKWVLDTKAVFDLAAKVPSGALVAIQSVRIDSWRLRELAAEAKRQRWILSATYARSTFVRTRLESAGHDRNGRPNALRETFTERPAVRFAWTRPNGTQGSVTFADKQVPVLDKRGFRTGYKPDTSAPFAMVCFPAELQDAAE